jgi:hypothetical protein
MTISLAFDFAWNCKGGRSFGKQMPPPRCFQFTCATHWPSGANFFSCYGTKGGFER